MEKKRRFLIGFSFNTDKGFGFGNWVVETDGALASLEEARDFGSQACKDNGYNALTIISISEVSID